MEEMDCRASLAMTKKPSLRGACDVAVQLSVLVMRVGAEATDLRLQMALFKHC
jgi:hypothetical protein